MDILKVNYFANRVDYEKALYHTDRALVIAADVAPEGAYKRLLKQSVLFNGTLNNFRASLKRYVTLLETDKDLALDDPIRSYAEQIRQALNGDANIATHGKISLCTTCGSPVAYWTRDLNRNRFLINQVAGEVSEVEVECRNGSVSLVYEPPGFYQLREK